MMKDEKPLSPLEALLNVDRTWISLLSDQALDSLVDGVYRFLIRHFHSDTGGSDAATTEINLAYKEFKRGTHKQKQKWRAEYCRAPPRHVSKALAVIRDAEEKTEVAQRALATRNHELSLSAERESALRHEADFYKDLFAAAVSIEDRIYTLSKTLISLTKPWRLEHSLDSHLRLYCTDNAMAQPFCFEEGIAFQPPYRILGSVMKQFLYEHVLTPQLGSPEYIEVLDVPIIPRLLRGECLVLQKHKQAPMLVFGLIEDFERMSETLAMAEEYRLRVRELSEYLKANLRIESVIMIPDSSARALLKDYFGNSVQRAREYEP